MDKRLKKPEHGASPFPLTIEEIIARRRERIAVIRGARALLTKITAVIAVCWFLLTFVFGVSVVKDEGMYPRLRDGDLVIFYRLADCWNIGDIAVYTADGQRQYGRVVASGGDTVDMTENGQLVVNSSVQQEEIFLPTCKEGRKTSFPVTLRKGEVFVLGDNRISASDSRDFGPVAIKDIKGKVISLFRRRGL